MSRDGDYHALSSVHVHIDTKYNKSGTPTDCKVQVPRIDHKYQFVIQEAVLDFTFYNIRHGRNSLTINEYISSDLTTPTNSVTLTITEGSYTLPDLVTIIGDALSQREATPINPYQGTNYTLSSKFKYTGTGVHTVSYNSYNGKISFSTNNSTNLLHITPNSAYATNLWSILGFESSPKFATLTGDNLADVYPHPYVFVLSNALTKYGSKSHATFSEGLGSLTFDNIVCCIPLNNHTFGERIYFNDNRTFQYDPEQENADIDLQLVHQDGEIVNLHGGSLKLTLSFIGSPTPVVNL